MYVGLTFRAVLAWTNCCFYVIVIIEVAFVRKIRRYIISFIIVLSMLISGMCFDNYKADSSLDYMPFSSPAASISSCSTDAADSAICTAEMLGIHNISYVRPATRQSSGLRKDIKASFEFLCEKAQSHLNSNFLMAAGIMQFPKLYFQAVVSQYR